LADGAHPLTLQPGAGQAGFAHRRFDQPIAKGKDFRRNCVEQIGTRRIAGKGGRGGAGCGAGGIDMVGRRYAEIRAERLTTGRIDGGKAGLGLMGGARDQNTAVDHVLNSCHMKIPASGGSVGSAGRGDGVIRLKRELRPFRR
jgi:hypothetical protein